MQRFEPVILNSLEQIESKSIAIKLGFTENDVIHLLRSADKCKAITILFKAGCCDKEKLHDNVVYGEELPRLIILLEELKLTKFYQKALAEYSFTYNVLQILQHEFKNQISEEMLESKVAIDALLGIKDSVESFSGFKIMFAAGLITEKLPPHYIENHICSSNFYKAALLMSENGLSNHLKVLEENPDLCTKFIAILAPCQKNEARHISSLCQILDAIPSNERFNLICKLMTVQNLKDIHTNTNRYDWRAIKSTLVNDADKLALSESIYTPEEIGAKKILKNIKNTIKTTNWPNELTDPKHLVTTNTDTLEVPFSLGRQVHTLWSISPSKLSPVNKLAEIKKIGKQQGLARNNMMTPMKHFFIGKSETAKYFDYFLTEEAFNNKFGLK
jgi:hypothetical protein